MFNITYRCLLTHLTKLQNCSILGCHPRGLIKGTSCLFKSWRVATKRSYVCNAILPHICCDKDFGLGTLLMFRAHLRHHQAPTSLKHNCCAQRCRSKQIFGGAKDFCPNFAKLVQKVVVQLLPTGFWCDLHKMVFTCFSANVGRHFCLDFQGFCQNFQRFFQRGCAFFELLKYTVNDFCNAYTYASYSSRANLPFTAS